MKSASFLRKPLPHIADALADRLASDIIKMEGAKTWDELTVVCHNIEARHAVEGISDSDKRAYEAVKQAHVRRVAGSFLA